MKICQRKRRAWSLLFWTAFVLAPVTVAAAEDGDATEPITSVFAVSGMT